MTLGQPNQPSSPMSGEPFNLPTHLAIDPRNGDLYVADGYSNARFIDLRPTDDICLLGESQARVRDSSILSITSQPIKMGGIHC